MARLPAATRDTVPPGQEATFDEITQNGSAVPPYGPGSVMVHVPEASKHATALNQYLRNDASLPMKAAELAMLVAAREMDCQHIWNAHAASARDAGVPAAVVDAIRDNTALPDLAPDESAVIHLGREILRNHQVSRGSYQRRAGDLRPAGHHRVDPGAGQLHHAGYANQHLRDRSAPR